MKQDPYAIIKHVHVTEKSMMLGGLQSSESNPSVAAFKKPVHVFIVDVEANKQQIKQAIEEIYRSSNVKVTNVNTVLVKGKKKRVRGRVKVTPAFKKAIVTFEEGDKIEFV